MCVRKIIVNATLINEILKLSLGVIWFFKFTILLLLQKLNVSYIYKKNICNVIIVRKENREMS